MGVQGNISLFYKHIDSSHPLFERIKNIEKYVISGSNLTKQLLGFARGGKYDAKPTNLKELITKTTELFSRTRKEINIATDFQNDVWTVNVDQGQIEQTLINLYVNAWQAMPSGGDLTIKVRNTIVEKDRMETYSGLKPGNYVKISIIDTGIGMDENTRQRVFEPFFTTKEMGRGTGLGLASAYGIITNHRGIIQVFSKKGQGSTFVIYLPVTEAQLVMDETVSEEPLRGTETILLVEDEEMIIDVCDELLKDLGYKVLVARSGQEALNLYKDYQDVIDLIVLDMVMPKMSGKETYAHLKEINPEVKVLLSSGYSRDERANEIMAQGCNGFIQKPFNMNILSKKIREIIDQQS
jgi:DNA-binding response OmpR family regulator